MLFGDVWHRNKSQRGERKARVPFPGSLGLLGAAQQSEAQLLPHSLNRQAGGCGSNPRGKMTIHNFSGGFDRVFKACLGNSLRGSSEMLTASSGERVGFSSP